MEQYFSGRTRAPIEETIEQQEKVEDKIFSNERVDDRWNKSHLRIFNSTFAKMGFRSSQFKQCDLSFCVFIDCYFKKTFFDQVKFISCIFIYRIFNTRRISPKIHPPTKEYILHWHKKISILLSLALSLCQI